MIQGRDFVKMTNASHPAFTKIGQLYMYDSLACLNASINETFHLFSDVRDKLMEYK
jgi:hypothetical protein